MKTIAFLGLGAMGQRMAARLLQAGYRVRAYNRSAEPRQQLARQGATCVATPREAVREADAVISMVTDDQAARAVWLHPETGALGGLPAGALAIESSTVTIGWVRELSAAVTAVGARFLDAPVAGSRPQADAGRLIFLVGGLGTLDNAPDVRQLLSSMGLAVHAVGPVGTGALMKLVVNGFFGVQVAALGELLGLAERGGIPRGAAAEVLASMPITSPALQGIGALMAQGRFAPMFPIDLVAKDFGYIVDAGGQAAQMPMAAAAAEVYERARTAGLGSANIAGVAQLYLDDPA